MTITDPEFRVKVTDVQVGDDMLTVDLDDGRVLSVPLWWYPKLWSASAEERQRWNISGAGYGIHWPDIDEDISVWGLLQGMPARGARPPSTVSDV